MTNGSSGFSGASDASGPDFHAVPREDGTKDSALGERDRRGLDVRAFCFVFLGDEGGNEMVGAEANGAGGLLAFGSTTVPFRLSAFTAADKRLLPVPTAAPTGPVDVNCPSTLTPP